MKEELADVSWTELCFGTAFLAAGSGGPERNPAHDQRSEPWRSRPHIMRQQGQQPARLR